MNHSHGSWMLTGGTRGEIEAEARQIQHLQAIRELRTERRAAGRAQRSAAITGAISGLRTRFSFGTTHAEPDGCPA